MQTFSNEEIANKWAQDEGLDLEKFDLWWANSNVCFWYPKVVLPPSTKEEPPIETPSDAGIYAGVSGGKQRKTKTKTKTKKKKGSN